MLVMWDQFPYKGNLSTFLPCEDTMGRQLSMEQETGSHQTLSLLATRSWTSQPPELRETNVCCLATQSVVVCCSGPNRRRQEPFMWFAVPFIYRCAIAVHPRAGMASRNTASVHCADSPCTVTGRCRATGYGSAQHQGCVQNGWGRDLKHTVPELVYRKVC